MSSSTPSSVSSKERPRRRCSPSTVARRRITCSAKRAAPSRRDRRRLTTSRSRSAPSAPASRRTDPSRRRSPLTSSPRPWTAIISICAGCGKRDALKIKLSGLPHVLCVGLKRFDFDLQTLRRVSSPQGRCAVGPTRRYTEGGTVARQHSRSGGSWAAARRRHAPPAGRRRPAPAPRAARGAPAGPTAARCRWDGRGGADDGGGGGRRGDDGDDRGQRRALRRRRWQHAFVLLGSCTRAARWRSTTTRSFATSRAGRGSIRFARERRRRRRARRRRGRRTAARAALLMCRRVRRQPSRRRRRRGARRRQGPRVGATCEGEGGGPPGAVCAPCGRSARLPETGSDAAKQGADVRHLGRRRHPRHRRQPGGGRRRRRRRAGRIWAALSPFATQTQPTAPTADGGADATAEAAPAAEAAAGRHRTAAAAAAAAARAVVAVARARAGARTGALPAPR